MATKRKEEKLSGADQPSTGGSRRKKITYVSVDFGREDLNNLGSVVNQLVDRANEK